MQNEQTPVDSLVAEIQRGASLSDMQLCDVLKRGARRERFNACRALALALASKGEQLQSRLLAQRAFLLWDGEPCFVDEYLDLLRADNNAEEIRRVSKRAGLWMAEHGNLREALRYFYVHQYAYLSTGEGDHYEYDHDILKATEKLAQACFSSNSPKNEFKSNNRRPLRIAYLLFGAGHINSVLVRLMADFARHHDHDNFECLYFSPDINLPSRQASAALLLAAGTRLVTVDSTNEIVCLKNTEKNIREFCPDILVSVAALADYHQYYLYCCFPDVVRIALCYGPPAQYAPPNADFVIAANWHPLMDSPCDGAVIELEATLSGQSHLSGHLPEGIVIPDGVVVLLAAGRSEKFLNRQYWLTIFEALRTHADTHFVAIGLSNRPPFLDELLTDDIKSRVTITGWLTNYHDLLARSDVVLDTFPSGGGLTIMDGMAQGKPVISFSNDYLRPFDQMAWSLADEVMGLQELIVPRGDFSEFSRRLSALIEEPAMRETLGMACKAHIEQTRGKPERMVRRIEAQYLDVVHQTRTKGRLSGNPPSMPLDDFSPRVSIVIPVFNGANYLRAAIDSALAQTYQNIEVIVVNDGSQDDGATELIALSYGDRVRYFSKENGGVASALNLAIANMTGEYFSWLSHDDLYYPCKIESQVKALTGMIRERAILYSDFSVFSDNPDIVHDIHLPTVLPENFRYFLTIANSLHGCTLLIPREAFSICGIFNENLRTTQDYDLWFRMAEKFTFVHVQEVLVKGRQHSEQGSITMKDVSMVECNVMLSGFVDSLSAVELAAGKHKSACLSYAEIAASFEHRHFYSAAKFATNLSFKCIGDGTIWDAICAIVIVFHTAIIRKRLALVRRFGNLLKPIGI